MKAIDQYETEKANKQLASWTRWVDAREIQRKLRANPPEWNEWLDKQLFGTHYTLTEDVFNVIKQKYNAYKTGK